MDKISTLISEGEVDLRVKELGEKISEDFKGEEVTVICILKGSVYFVTELTKRMTVPVKLEFMRCSSYGDGQVSSRKIDVKIDLDENIEGKNVLVVEDIIDSGNTLSFLMKYLSEKKPASLKLCTLLDKPARRESEVFVDYVGFEIPDKFVVGYGLDYAQNYRNLPYIGVVETE